MKSFLAAATLTVLAPTLSFAANSCHEVLSQGPLHLETIAQVRTNYVKDLVAKGFENDSYIVNWKVKDEEFQGPLPADGKFVVTRVTPEKRKVWLETVGKESIGFAVRFDYNPADKNTTFIKTAWIRIGDTIHNFGAIQAEWIIPEMLRSRFNVDLNKETDLLTTGIESGFVEATFKMTSEEVATIKQFMDLRRAGVKATSVIKGTKEVLKPDGTVRYKAIPDVQVGQVIHPKFNEEKMGLILEGCAGACSSWMNPEWHAHIDPVLVEKLTRIQEKYGLFTTPVARQLIWRNSRNPHVLGLTLIEGRKLEHEDPFIETHSWGNLRGMAIYGTIPDPVSDSIMIDSTRTPIKQWLEKQGQ